MANIAAAAHNASSILTKCNPLRGGQWERNPSTKICTGPCNALSKLRLSLCDGEHSNAHMTTQCPLASHSAKLAMDSGLPSPLDRSSPDAYPGAAETKRWSGGHHARGPAAELHTADLLRKLWEVSLVGNSGSTTDVALATDVRPRVRNAPLGQVCCLLAYFLLFLLFFLVLGTGSRQTKLKQGASSSTKV